MQPSSNASLILKGAIAFGWVDGRLSDGERQQLQAFIANNQNITEEQRTELMASLETPASIEDIWTQLTDKQDRATLLDLAGTLYNVDGNYSAPEKALYDRLLKEHLATLDQQAVQQDLQKLAGLMHQNSVIDEQSFEVQLKKDNNYLSKIELFVYRINKALGYD